jgi:methionine-rich copper-binding protein CopC
MRIPALLAALALGLAAPGAVSAHVEVTASIPSAKAPRTVSIAFSQPVDPASAAASIVMTAMPGVANYGEMAIRNFTPNWSADGQTLTLNLRQPLRAGTYELRWQATAQDGHAVSGVVTFEVA